jgi:hypothetical protein
MAGRFARLARGLQVRSGQGGVDRSGPARSFLVFAGRVEPLLHGDGLCGVQCMGEGMGGLAGAAGEVAAAAQE